ncbi:hypothetical protein [Nibribacter koreensis]
MLIPNQGIGPESYKHALWLAFLDLVAVVMMAYMGGYTLVQQLPQLFA